MNKILKNENTKKTLGINGSNKLVSYYRKWEIID